jgi:hypothetical protein
MPSFLRTSKGAPIALHWIGDDPRMTGDQYYVWLDVLKLLALGVSSALGLIATFGDTRDKEKGHLTALGWITVIGVIVSGVIAARTQTLESEHARDERREEADKQAKLFETARRAATPFSGHVNLEGRFRIPISSDDAKLAELIRAFIVAKRVEFRAEKEGRELTQNQWQQRRLALGNLTSRIDRCDVQLVVGDSGMLEWLLTANPTTPRPEREFNVNATLGFPHGGRSTDTGNDVAYYVTFDWREGSDFIEVGFQTAPRDNQIIRKRFRSLADFGSTDAILYIRGVPASELETLEIEDAEYGNRLALRHWKTERVGIFTARTRSDVMTHSPESWR